MADPEGLLYTEFQFDEHVGIADSHVVENFWLSDSDYIYVDINGVIYKYVFTSVNEKWVIEDEAVAERLPLDILVNIESTYEHHTEVVIVTGMADLELIGWGIYGGVDTYGWTWESYFSWKRQGYFYHFDYTYIYREPKEVTFNLYEDWSLEELTTVNILNGKQPVEEWVIEDLISGQHLNGEPDEEWVIEDEATAVKLPGVYNLSVGSWGKDLDELSIQETLLFYGNKSTSGFYYTDFPYFGFFFHADYAIAERTVFGTHFVDEKWGITVSFSHVYGTVLSENFSLEEFVLEPIIESWGIEDEAVATRNDSHAVETWGIEDNVLVQVNLNLSLIQDLSLVDYTSGVTDFDRCGTNSTYIDLPTFDQQYADGTVLFETSKDYISGIAVNEVNEVSIIGAKNRAGYKAHQDNKDSVEIVSVDIVFNTVDVDSVLNILHNNAGLPAVLYLGGQWSGIVINPNSMLTKRSGGLTTVTILFYTTGENKNTYNLGNGVSICKKPSLAPDNKFPGTGYGSGYGSREVAVIPDESILALNSQPLKTFDNQYILLI